MSTCPAQRRPGSVTAVGVLLIIGGALEIVLGLIYLTNADRVLDDLARPGVTQAQVAAIGSTLLALGLIAALLATPEFANTTGPNRSTNL